MNIKNFPKTSDITLNYENGWLDIHLNNVENRNALKQNFWGEIFFPSNKWPIFGEIQLEIPQMG